MNCHVRWNGRFKSLTEVGISFKSLYRLSLILQKKKKSCINDKDCFGTDLKTIICRLKSGLVSLNIKDIFRDLFLKIVFYEKILLFL